MKITNNKFRNKFGMTGTLAAILSVFMFFGCDQLQDSLSSEQQTEMDEDIGYAYLDGNVWYYDGISTTDFSSTTGAALAVHFTKKVEMAGTKKLEDNGTYTYSYELSGSFSANYTTTTGQSASVVTKITGGKVVLDTSDETTNISAGTLSADGKTFRLDMTPVCKLLDAATASGNELDSVEIKLKGFVCAEGDQKGRSLPAFGKIIKVKPFYGPATNATFSGVDFFLCHILTDNYAKSEMQDYYWIAAAPGRTDGVETSATSTSESVIEYKIPLSIIASAATGNTLKVFVTTTSYAWTTINETTLQDCIPSAAATVSDGGQTLSIDFANALEYTVKSSE